ncbi:HAD hydrolase-like protein [Microcella alkaliphila]|uniref:Phosphoglycolate phosphatase n=1 Tax=Microcella alkaliphila TaxID=279828 RepID=A0A0U5B5D9_9MICO|nr:HAD hydrolase-like protein [Microcella alkaliphila]BAU31129.1 phosphoglycolate phosphatase [Microcella alkaliphila]
MSLPYTTILLDLDGTVVDSAPGIIDTLKRTFVALELPVPDDAELLRYVGPPILDSFRDRAGMTLEQRERALEVYRAQYLDQGAYDSRLFPGMGLFVADIDASGLPLSLATSKPETPATLMLEHFTIAHHFDIITGASDDEVRSAKADVIAEALVRLKAFGADLSRPIMIGDRIHDVEGARVHGIPTIGVSWGYAEEGEFEHAIAVVDTVDELRSLIGLPAEGDPRE